MRKAIWLKIFASIFFINLLVYHLLDAAPFVIYRWRNVPEKISTTSNFRLTFAVTIEVNKYNDAKNSSGFCCYWPHSANFQICVTILVHSSTPINEVCLEPLRPSCGYGVTSTFLLVYQMDLPYTKPHCWNLKQFKYCFILTSFLCNFAEFDAENWFGLIWPL